MSVGDHILVCARSVATWASIAALGIAACNGSSQNATDGGSDVVSDTSMGDVQTDSPSTDTPPGDGGSCTQYLPPSGFVNIAMGDTVGYETAFTVDEHGSPIVAWAQSQGSASTVDVFIRRWNGCAGAWDAPIHVDGGFNQSTNTAETPSSHNIGVAYDHSTGAIGVAYQTQDPTDSHYEIRYAQLARGATSFGAVERVQVQTDTESWLFNPAVALANGTAFLAYQQAWLLAGGATTGVAYRSRSSDGTWGAAQPIMHSEGGHTVYGVISMAVDGSGMPGLVFWTQPLADYTTIARYWHVGMSAAVDVITEGQTDDPGVSLTFDGMHPRIAAAVNDPTVPTNTVWYSGSSDGTNWSTPVPMANDNGSHIGRWVSIAVNGMGAVAIASTKTGGDGTDTCGSPEISRSTNLTSFVTCGPPQSVFNGSTEYVEVAYGPDGKIEGAFRHPPGDSMPSGVFYFREN